MNEMGQNRSGMGQVGTERAKSYERQQADTKAAIVYVKSQIENTGRNRRQRTMTCRKRTD